MRERTARSVAVRMRHSTGQIVPEHEQVRPSTGPRRRTPNAPPGTAWSASPATSPSPSPTPTSSKTPAPRWKPTPPRPGSRLRRMWFAHDARLRHGRPTPRLRPTPEAVVTRMLRRKRRNDLPVADFADLLGTSRHHRTAAPTAPARPDRVPAEPIPPRRGWARPFAGRAARPPRSCRPSAAPPARSRASTPGCTGRRCRPVGAYLGVDCLSGGAFSCHPIEWLHRGFITNPNLLITGVPGSGKSATIKALCFRLMAYGVRSLRPRRHQERVRHPSPGTSASSRSNSAPASRPGSTPSTPGRSGRNLPTDPDRLRERLDEIHRRRITLLASLLVVRLGRDLTPTEEAALSLAIQHASGEADRRQPADRPDHPRSLGAAARPAAADGHRPAGARRRHRRAAGDDPPGRRRPRQHGPRLAVRAVRRTHHGRRWTSTRRSRPSTCPASTAAATKPSP